MIIAIDCIRSLKNRRINEMLLETNMIYTKRAEYKLIDAFLIIKVFCNLKRVW